MLALSGLSGCHVFDESLIARDASVDSGPVCELKTPPARPAIVDAPDGEELVFAIRDLVLDQRAGERWRTVGYDQDGLCSVQPMPMVECRPPQADQAPELDGENGIDNAFGHRFIPGLLVILGDIQQGFQKQEADGRGVMLVRLRGWSGRDDDPKVDAVVAQSAFGLPPDGDSPPNPELDDAGVRHGDASLTPSWAGSDYFWARSDGFLENNPSLPRLRDDNAYVAARKLVVRLPGRVPLLFWGNGIGLELRLIDAYLTGTLSPDGSKLEEAVLAGRWSLLDIYETFAPLGICKGADNYAFMKNLLDQSADAREVAGTGASNVACDALTVGILATGYKARWGGLAQDDALPNSCP